MNQCQTTMLVGDLGAGKSTTIFGVRRELREEGQEYVHVNGHFVDKQNHIVHAIDTARRRKMSVIYDSFDYLFRRKSTSFRKETAVARKIILGKIRDLVDSGSGLLLSSHTEPWLRFHLSTDSLDEYNAVRDELGATSHRIVGYLGDESERRALAYDITESDEFTGQYMQYSNQSELRTSRTYRVMKLMARSNLALLGQQQFNEAVMAIDKQSRAKMRAPEDYDLCPLPDGI